MTVLKIFASTELLRSKLYSFTECISVLEFSMPDRFAYDLLFFFEFNPPPYAKSMLLLVSYCYLKLLFLPDFDFS